LLKDIRNRKAPFLTGISVHWPSRITAFSRQVFERRYSQFTPCLSIQDQIVILK